MATNRSVLDAGAVSALAAEEGSIRVVLRRLAASGSTVVVPTPIVAETTTGEPGRDARVNRVLKGATIEPLDEATAREAGRLRYRHRLRRAGTIDAMVVASADAQPGSIILTSDAGDLEPLAHERERSIVVSLT